MGVFVILKENKLHMMILFQKVILVTITWRMNLNIILSDQFVKINKVDTKIPKFPF